ncbi:MAG: ATP-grasp fold amidoligase family protein [Bdellovibrionota bacterium]|nr:hypothetical protein [Deltaproteobacteria bacterium]
MEGKKESNFLQIHRESFINRERIWMTLAWKRLNYCTRFIPSTSQFNRPDNLARLLEMATIVASYFSAILADFFTDGKAQVFIKELTHCNGNADLAFYPKKNIERKIIFSYEGSY